MSSDSSDSKIAGSLKSHLSLLDGEEVLVNTRPAKSAYLKQYIFAAIVILFGLGATAESSSEAPLIAAFLLAIPILGYIAYHRRKVRYIVTDRRLIKVLGISSKSTSEVWMEDVRGLQTGASFSERIFGHGHITVSESFLPLGNKGLLLRFIGLGGITFGNISKHQEVAEKIRERQNERKEGNN